MQRKVVLQNIEFHGIFARKQPVDVQPTSFTVHCDRISAPGSELVREHRCARRHARMKGNLHPGMRERLGVEPEIRSASEFDLGRDELKPG